MSNYAGATIIRAKHDKDYFCMQRATAQDRDLSFEARGLIAYLLSKSDGWEITPKDLEQGCKKGRIYRILDELKTSGYLEDRQRNRTSDGRWQYTPYKLHERPVNKVIKMPTTDEKQLENSPLPQKPDTDEPDTVLPHTEKAEIKEDSTELDSTEKDSASGTGAVVLELPEPKQDTTPDEPKESTPPKLTKAERDEWYEAVFEVFKESAGLNGKYQKFLQGEITDKKNGAWLIYQLSPDSGLTPDLLRQWGKQYRRDNPTMTILKQPIKIQSALITFLDAQKNPSEPTYQAPYHKPHIHEEVAISEEERAATIKFMEENDPFKDKKAAGL